MNKVEYGLPKYDVVLCIIFEIISSFTFFFQFLREQSWRSGESARLQPMCPGFDSRTRCHMWVEFVVGSLLCSERFFSGNSGFPLSWKTNISKFQFDLEYCQALYHEPLAWVIVQALPMFDAKKITFVTFTISSFNCFLPRVLNTSHAFSNIVNKHGVRGLWKGWAPNVQRAALVNMGGKFNVKYKLDPWRLWTCEK